MLWLFAALFVILNIWYDIRNPAHAIIDGILVLTVVLTFLFSRFAG